MKLFAQNGLCALAALSAFSLSANAQPLHPNERKAPGTFSAEIEDAFQLLADSDDPNLIHYVPKRGGVAVQNPTSDSPRPRFSIFERTPSFGFFAGMPLVHLGGSLSTTSGIAAQDKLKAAAAAQGLRVSPAPVKTATTKFMLSGLLNEDGRVDVDCTKEDLTVTRPDGSERVISIPNCKLKSDENGDYDLTTNVMYKFRSIPASSNSLVSQDISFQAVTLPEWDQPLRNLMTIGAQWDSILTAAVDWEIESESLTRQARFTISWEQVFEQAEVFAAYHNFACVDVELKGFYENLSQCQDPEDCGIKIEYMKDGVWVDEAPSDSDFIGVVNAMQKELTQELFNEVDARSKSELGRVSQEKTAVYTLRANYEKRIFERNEIRLLQYNPGKKDFNSRTTLNIDCLTGGFEEGVVGWKNDDASCRALLVNE